MTETEVLVIGAGPAGALAAIAARRAGACVTLVERAHFPRPKVCGSCLSEAGLAALRQAGAADACDDAIPLRVLRLRGGGRELSLARRAGVAIGRVALDARLAERARVAGADVRFETPATARPDGRWDVGGVAMAARCAVVADGIGGRALQALPQFDWQVSASSRMGFGAILPAGAVQCAPGDLCMHVQPDGYVGAVMLPDGSVDVAAAAHPHAVRAAGGPAAYAARALGALVMDPRALHAAEWRGTPTLTRRRQALAAPGILVAGDAAGYVEPFTGEGMGWALMTGAAAGSLAARVARGEASHESWPGMHATLVRTARARCRAIALALRWPRAVRTALAVGAAVPRLAQHVSDGIGRAPRGTPVPAPSATCPEAHA
jgi:flavin-dependent dehydrogenase